MNVVSKTIKVSSKGEDDIIDITEELSNIVKESNIENGTVTVFI